MPQVAATGASPKQLPKNPKDILRLFDLRPVKLQGWEGKFKKTEKQAERHLFSEHASLQAAAATGD